MCFFGFGAGENERETHHGWIAEQWHSNLSPLKGEMSRSDRGVPLRAATLPTSPFRGGFAKGTCSNLSPLKGEMSRSDRWVPLRAAMLPTSPERGGFAKGTCSNLSPLKRGDVTECSNLSPLKGEMSRSDRGVLLNKTPVWKRIGKEQNPKNGKCYRRFSHCS